MFVGRENELATLEELYAQNRFQMVVMYGRRRVGKTTLISKFSDSKPSIFFTAQEASDKINLQEFSRKIYDFFKMPKSTGTFESWKAAIEFLGEKAQKQQFVLAFDEFPYAAEANTGLKSVLQNAIDHILKDSRLFLILCGSQIAFMENEVLGYKSPLFGRRTAQINLLEFDYFDAAKLLDGFSNEEKIMLYSCIGGTPHYLAQVNQALTFEENIKRLFFDISGYLYNEPTMLLQQELRELALYNSIVCAIAGGCSRLNEISNHVSEESSKVNKYLRTLLNLRIVKKAYPLGENPENSKKGIYMIADNCYNFWYRFVFLNKPEIESGNGYLVAEQEAFGEFLSNYVGHAYEEICMQYLARKNKQGCLPFAATNIGRWWGNDSQTKRQIDIDVALTNKKTGDALLAECKWRNSLSYSEEVQKLIGKKHLLPEYKNKYFFFFSKKPWSACALEEAAEHNVNVICNDDLFCF